MLRLDIGLVATLSTCSAMINEGNYPSHRIIHTDVAILGGGASGAYAAVRLREDYGSNIVVIEKADRLGGHADTYFDPISTKSINYGVQVYTPYGPARDFFARFNIETAPSSSVVDIKASTINVDIANGKNLSAYHPPSLDAVTVATKIWLDICKKYEYAMKPGYWNFFAPGTIPSELLLPFGDFTKHYGIEAIAPSMALVANVGVGGFEDIPTWQIMAFAFGVPITQGIIDNSFFIPKDAPNTVLYDKIYSRIKEDVMLNSEVIAAHRDEYGVRLVVQNNQYDTQTLIKAKKLLVSFQPTLESLAPLHLNHRELSFFETFTPTWLFVGILHVPFIPPHTTVDFIPFASVPSNYLKTRDTPFSFKLIHTGDPETSQLFQFQFTSNYSVSYHDVKAATLENIQKLLDAGTYQGDIQDVEFLAMKDHNSVLWRQPNELAQAGLMQEANALQGYRGTWWTGGLWSSDYSADVWAFTEDLLGRMMGR